MRLTRTPYFVVVTNRQCGFKTLCLLLAIAQADEHSDSEFGGELNGKPNHKSKWGKDCGAAGDTSRITEVLNKKAGIPLVANSYWRASRRAQRLYGYVSCPLLLKHRQGVPSNVDREIGEENDPK